MIWRRDVISVPRAGIVYVTGAGHRATGRLRIAGATARRSQYWKAAIPTV